MRKKFDYRAIDQSQGKKLIWKHTHNDYKALIDGKKSLMVAGGEIQFLDTMSSDSYDNAVKDAVRRENGEACKEIVVDLCKKHGVWPLDNGMVNQCFGTFSGSIRAFDMLDYENDEGLSEKVELLVTDIEKAERDFDPTAEVRDAMIRYLQKEHGLTTLNKHDNHFIKNQNNDEGVKQLIESKLDPDSQAKAKGKLLMYTCILERKLNKNDVTYGLG
ncbi:hypothetical protein [Vibrio owensii]|uniref:hypothetical protein n=1 Tax=Vibrio owensii TaxID=696485 RepID=UPI003CC5124A